MACCRTERCRTDARSAGSGMTAAFALALTAGPASATTYTVSTLDDTSGNSDCSLGDAINAANGTPTSGSTCTTAGSGSDTIQFSVTGTIALNCNFFHCGPPPPPLPEVSDKGLTISGPTGGITLDGGGLVVAPGAALTVKNMTITHGDGGGILNLGTLTTTNSSFSDNLARSGAAIYNLAGKLTVTNSTFSGNTNGTIFGEGTVTVTNSTFFGNSGVAISNFGPLTVTNSTFLDNLTALVVVVGGPFSIPGSAVAGNPMNFPAIVKNTIMASSTGGNCLGASFGGITDAGYNISDDDSCGFAKTGSANNGDGVNPLLSAAGLANNGGPTETIGLNSESPAIDAIPSVDCTDQSSPPKAITTDQRGFPRPDFGEDVCDIGAFESQETFAGQPGASNCHGQSVSALSNMYGTLAAAASALGFSNVQALQAAIRAFCGG